ncbi:4687_t:CDS:2, partial [Cetraspora pellucida]
ARNAFNKIKDINDLTPEKINIIAKEIKLENEIYEIRKIMDQPLTNLELQWLCIIIGRSLKIN